MGREEEIAYAREHGIPVKGGTEARPVLDRRQPLGPLVRGQGDRGPRAARRPTTSSSSSPGRRTRRTSRSGWRSRFERGRPVALDGERLDLVDADRPRGGGGLPPRRRASSTTSRTGSSASRSATSTRCRRRRSCSTAHQDLEKLVSTIHQNEHKHALDRKWAYLVYAGLWLDPLRRDLDAYMDSANERVTGEITVELYKGSVRVVARRSPYALYDESLASFGESGGEFSQAASPGFIELFTLQSRMAHRIGERAEGEGERRLMSAHLRADRALRRPRRLVALRPPDPDRRRGRAGRSRSPAATC